MGVIFVCTDILFFSWFMRSVCRFLRHRHRLSSHPILMLCAQRGGENGGSGGKEKKKNASNVFCEAFDWRGTVPGWGLRVLGGSHGAGVGPCLAWSWRRTLGQGTGWEGPPPPSLGLWCGPEGLIVLLTVLVPPFLQCKKKKKERRKTQHEANIFKISCKKIGLSRRKKLTNNMIQITADLSSQS